MADHREGRDEHGKGASHVKVPSFDGSKPAALRNIFWCLDRVAQGDEEEAKARFYACLRDEAYEFGMSLDLGDMNWAELKEEFVSQFIPSHTCSDIAVRVANVKPLSSDTIGQFVRSMNAVVLECGGKTTDYAGYMYDRMLEVLRVSVIDSLPIAILNEKDDKKRLKLLVENLENRSRFRRELSLWDMKKCRASVSGDVMYKRGRSKSDSDEDTPHVSTKPSPKPDRVGTGQRPKMDEPRMLRPRCEHCGKAHSSDNCWTKYPERAPGFKLGVKMGAMNVSGERVGV